MTITLFDVKKLIGTRTMGFPMYFDDSEIDYIELCHELLGVTPPDEISMSWFRRESENPLPVEATDIEIEQRTRVIILYCLNLRLFNDHSKGRYNLKYLPLLRDFQQFSHYS